MKRTWFAPGTYYAKNRDVVLARAKARHHTLNAKAAGAPPPGKCDLCLSDGRVTLDHCHTTGQARGWLCYGCNIMLGRRHDDAAFFERVAAYLRRGGTGGVAAHHSNLALSRGVTRADTGAS